MLFLFPLCYCFSFRVLFDLFCFRANSVSFSALLFCSVYSYGLWYFNCCFYFINENNCQSTWWFVSSADAAAADASLVRLFYALSFAQMKLSCSPQQHFIYAFNHHHHHIEIILWKSKSVFKCNNNSKRCIDTLAAENVPYCMAHRNEVEWFNLHHN